MTTRRQLIQVTEPTLENGVWTLAAFDWRFQTTVTHQEIVDCLIRPEQFMNLQRNYTSLVLSNWLETMPTVARFSRSLEHAQTHNMINDSFVLTSKASGWFELSDDETKTENMLKLVNVERIEGMDVMVHRMVMPASVIPSMMPRTFFDEAAEISLLRPGSVDNDINPNIGRAARDHRDRQFREIIRREATLSRRLQIELDPRGEMTAFNYAGHPQSYPLFRTPSRAMMPPGYRNDGGMPDVDDRGVHDISAASPAEPATEPNLDPD